MQQQKHRSRAATAIDTEDWIVLDEMPEMNLSVTMHWNQKQSCKIQKSKSKRKRTYQIVLEQHLFMLKAADRLVIKEINI